jgi:hypothetical protein
MNKSAKYLFLYLEKWQKSLSFILNNICVLCALHHALVWLVRHLARVKLFDLKLPNVYVVLRRGKFLIGKIPEGFRKFSKKIFSKWKYSCPEDPGSNP